MKQIRLTKGLFALVNDYDFEWLNQWKWCASLESRGTKYYAIRRENGKKLRMHVEVYKKHSGLTEIPPGHVIDHVNHNSLDNRMVRFDEESWGLCSTQVQLEMVTQEENMRRSKGWKRKGVKVKMG